MENLTVAELKQKCKSLNIKLTKSDGSSKLKKDLIQNLNSLSTMNLINGGARRRKKSSKKTSKSADSKNNSRRRRSRKGSRRRSRKGSRKVSRRRSRKGSRKISRKVSRKGSRKKSKQRKNSKKKASKKRFSSKQVGGDKVIHELTQITNNSINKLDDFINEFNNQHYNKLINILKNTETKLQEHNNQYDILKNIQNGGHNSNLYVELKNIVNQFINKRNEILSIITLKNSNKNNKDLSNNRITMHGGATQAQLGNPPVHEDLRPKSPAQSISQFILKRIAELFEKIVERLKKMFNQSSNKENGGGGGGGNNGYEFQDGEFEKLKEDEEDEESLYL